MDLRYVRVSSARQDLERQIDALIAAGIPPERICLGTKPGAGDRTALRELIGSARDGELLIIVRPLDRLGRTVRVTAELICELSERGIALRNVVDPRAISASNQRGCPDSRERSSARALARGLCGAIIGKRGLIDSALASAAVVVGVAERPLRLLEPIQRQREIVQDALIERERGLQRQLIGRLLAPVDAGFDLLEENGRLLREQAQALETAGRALEESAGLVKRQAELFDRTVGALRTPAERARAMAGLERRALNGAPAGRATTPRPRNGGRRRQQPARARGSRRLASTP